MTSLSKLIRFLKGELNSRRDARRSQHHRGRELQSSEAMEPRLLLTINVQDVLYNAGSMDDVDPNDRIDSYLVKFQSAQDTAALTSATGAEAVTESPFVDNAYTFEFSSGLTLQEAADTFGVLSDFSYMHPHIVYTPVAEAVPNDPLFGNQWHLQNTGQGGGLVGIDANTVPAWDVATGAGVTIGIVDDGLQTNHPDFANNINTAIDFDWNGNDNDPSPGPNDNHGTAVAGVASADGNNSLGVSGAAWDAELVGLRLIAGGITERDIAQALTHQQGIIDIYNNSWGPGARDVIQNTFASGPEVVNALRDGAVNGRGGLGTIRVNSAGNGGPNSNSNYFVPTNSRYSIAVGALGNDGTLAGYSTPGAPVVLVAPSNGGTLGITTVDRTGTAGYDPTDYTSTFGGTSSAAPLVSGVIALMLDANPSLTYRDVVDILVHTSDQVDTADPSWEINGAGLPVSHRYGFGKVNAGAAVTAAVNHTPLAPEVSFATGQQIVNAQIPDQGSVSRTYTVSQANGIASLEWVEVVVSASHQFIGDLEITLTSPDGTRSVLTETRNTDSGTRLSNFVFTTIHHYGESSAGTWTLTVTDGAAQDIGTLDSFELRFYGTNAVPRVTESGGSTIVSDAGDTDFFDISLPVKPSGDVVINVVSADNGEVTVDKPQLIFTTTNWNTPQRVTVSGVTDLIRDFDQRTNVRIHVDSARSAPEYASAPDQFVQVVSIDNDFNLPTKLAFLAPGQRPETARPRFEWTGGVNAVKFELQITDVFTGNVVQHRDDLILPRHEFDTPFLESVYEALVRGINSDGVAGPWSDPLLFAIGEPAVPTAPVILSPQHNTTLTTNQPTIEWTAPPGSTDYEIYILQSGNVTRVVDRDKFVKTSTNTIQFVPETPLAEGFTSVWVRAFNPFGGPGPWSTPVGFIVDAFKKPTTPIITAPIVSVTTDATPTFRWIGPDSNKYDLWVNELPDANNGLTRPKRVLYVTDLVANAYTHFRPLNNATHRVWVRGINSAGEASDWSAFSEFTIAVPPPQTPRLRAIADGQDETPTIRWESASGDPFNEDTTFNLWVNNLTTGESRVIYETGLKGTSFTPKNGLGQGRFRAWVQSVNATGVKSAWSSALVFNIDIPAPGPTNINGPTPAQGTAVVETDQPTISWDAATGAVAYELWVNHRDENGTWTVRKIHETALQTNSYTPDSPLPQGFYKAWVRALNRANEVSAWSSAFSFTIDVPVPRVPFITGPEVNAVGVVPVSQPRITWNTLSPNKETYDLQVEVVLTGELVVNVVNLTDKFYDVPVKLQETTYRTRVRARNSAGETSAWSDWSTFRVDVPNATTPTLLGPTGTLTSEPVRFSWTHAQDNVLYEILVRDQLSRETIRIRRNVSDLTISQGTAYFETDELTDGTYRFWIRSFNGQNTPSGWSNGLTFTLDTAMADPAGSEGPEILLSALEYRPSLEQPRQVADQPTAPQQMEPPQNSADGQQQPVTNRKPGQKPEAMLDEKDSPELLAEVMAEFADPAAMLALDNQPQS